jgi:hypothetical protein
MKIAKFVALTGVAALALTAAAQARTGTTGATTATDAAQAPIMLAQNDLAESNAALEARVSALEEELQNAEVNQSRMAAAAPPPAPGGWWNNTSISGRMYFDFSNIEHKTNGSKTGNADNGTNFDIKRFYLGIDHTFNQMFSGNITTDVTYDSTTGASQIFIKKAWLQAKINPLLNIRLGADDMPWIPYAESIYGYRYLELTLIDRTKFGTSSDWGIHVLGSAFDGILNYNLAAVNGGGYKKIPIGGGTNRFNTVDWEGRVSAVYEGFNLALSGYSGKLGTPFGVVTHHDATRFNALAAYVANGIRLGVEYFNASDYSATAVAAAAPGDSAHGVSAYGSWYFLPQFAVFGRFDTVNPSTRSGPAKTNEYFNLGVTWTPVKTVDLSLAYKRDSVTHGLFTDSNGAIGSTTGAMNGNYSEIGLFGDFQW